jgi:hypothetical protein
MKRLSHRRSTVGVSILGGSNHSSLFAEFLGRYEEFENRVQVQAIGQLDSALVEAGATVAGDIFTIDGGRYRQYVEDPGIKRSLLFLFDPVSSSPVTLEVSSFDINQMGRVRSLVVEWPQCLKNKFEHLIEPVAKRMQKEYIGLQCDFEKAYESIVDDALDGLYDTMNREIRCQGKPYLQHCSWLAITDVNSTLFKYIFPPDRMRAMMEVLIGSQTYSIAHLTSPAA